MRILIAITIAASMILGAALQTYADILIRTKDGREFRVPVNPADVASIEFVGQKTSRPAEPSKPSSNANELEGTWSWVCCNGLHSGTFYIESVSGNGNFSGRFGSGKSDGATPISGSIAGDRVVFTRTILNNGVKAGEQIWRARLVKTGGKWVLAEGDWQGLARDSNNGGFSATRK